MTQLFDMALHNEKLITSLQKVIFAQEQKIWEGSKKLEESAVSDEETEDFVEEKFEVAKIENFHKKLITDSNNRKYTSLKQKIFRQKEYHYKIEIDG